MEGRVYYVILYSHLFQLYARLIDKVKTSRSKYKIIASRWEKYCESESFEALWANLETLKHHFARELCTRGISGWFSKKDGQEAS